MSLLKRNVGSRNNHLTFATEEGGGRLTNLDRGGGGATEPGFPMSSRIFFERIFVRVADKLFFGRVRSASERGVNSKYTFLRREGLRKSLC